MSIYRATEELHTKYGEMAYNHYIHRTASSIEIDADLYRRVMLECSGKYTHIYGLMLLPENSEPKPSALELDAARYRWLRDVGNENFRPYVKQWEPAGLNTAEKVDEKIDAAMAKDKS